MIDYPYLAMLRSLLVLLATISLISVEAAETTRKPNFILIFTDDLGYGDIGPFGSTKNRTPNLDRMANEGLKLTSFYAAPLCSASRTQVLTGCHWRRLSMPMVLFPGSDTGLPLDQPTVAELLKKQGYATACVGKWHVGDQPEFLPTQRGFDHYFGIPYSNGMGSDRIKYVSKSYPPLPLMLDDKVIEELEPEERQDTLTKRYTEEAVKFIQEQKANPFFLYFAHTAVHLPLHPGKEFQGKSGHGLYNDWVEEVDWSVGQVFETLRELKLDKETLVIFTSDNGGTASSDNGALRGKKGSTWEGGVRVPTLAWWPEKIKSGTTSDAVAANYDFLPTFVKLSGGELPVERKLDGRDLTALLLGQSKDSPHEAFYYFTSSRLSAVRSGPWKLVIVPQGPNAPQAPVERAKAQAECRSELYNLDTDIGETIDMAAKRPDEVARLQKLIQVMDADLGVKHSKGPGVYPAGKVAEPKQQRLKPVSWGARKTE